MRETRLSGSVGGPGRLEPPGPIPIVKLISYASPTLPRTVK